MSLSIFSRVEIPPFENGERGYVFAEQEFRYWEKYVEGPALDPARATSASEAIDALIDGMTRQTRLDSILPIVEAGLSERVPHDYEIDAGVPETS